MELAPFRCVWIASRPPLSCERVRRRPVPPRQVFDALAEGQKGTAIAVSTRRGARGKYEKRPPPCLNCGTPPWWNGRRKVLKVSLEADGGGTKQDGGSNTDQTSDGAVQQQDKEGSNKSDGAVQLDEEVRWRARCPEPKCPVGSWTVYEQDSYPHRSHGLEVVVQVVLAVVRTNATLDSVAAKHMCSRDSVRRWVLWVEGLADPGSVQKLCLRIDPDGLPAAAPKASGADQILQLLERLADLLAQRGVPLPPKGAGLVRILADRLARFGEVLWLTKSSPPLRADPLGAWV